MPEHASIGAPSYRHSHSETLAKDVTALQAKRLIQAANTEIGKLGIQTSVDYKPLR